MGIKERRQRERSETRDKILDAARELFSEHGYDGVSMRQVAEKIEYSPTAIYVHFADKEDLFHELCNEDFARLAAEFQSVPLPVDPIERIKQIGRSYIVFGLQHPNHYKLMFMTPHPGGAFDECDQEIKGNPEVDAYALLMQTVHEAMGEVRSCERRFDRTNPLVGSARSDFAGHRQEAGPVGGVASVCRASGSDARHRRSRNAEGGQLTCLLWHAEIFFTTKCGWQ
jgi:AcrR family transcriptional regulator